MLASSPLFSTPYGWPLDDHITKVCNDPNLKNQSLLDFPSFDQIQQDFAPETSGSFEGAVNGDMGDCMKVVRKLNHNASERDRRKKVNNLYASLRSVLPMSKKKVSIPGIVSHAVKYIPELQKELETLIHKKEKLRSYSSSNTYTTQEHLDIKKLSAKDAIMNEESSVVSSVSVLGEKEAVIQLTSSTKHIGKNKDILLLSKVLEKLEEEEDGFILLNATTFKCEGMSLNTMHFQVQGNHKIEAEKMKEKLCSFHQQ